MYKPKKIKFQNDFLIITASRNETVLFFKAYDGRKIRAELTKSNTTPKQAEKIAPILEKLIKRVYDMGFYDGHKKGKEDGAINIQKELKKLLNI